MRSDVDWTRQELAKALGMGINVICARIADLAEEIRINRVRPCTVTHRRVEALKLVSK